MILRDYQRHASDAIFREWETAASTLVVFPTGLGKTILFADVIRRAFPRRSLVIAHREELIFQACDKIHRSTGLTAGVEMGDARITAGVRLPPVIVATVQTLTAGGDGSGRMGKFDPMQFGALIVDECFPAGTLIDGVPIESIKVGDYVSAFDHETGRVVRSMVTRTFKSVPTEIARVRFSDGSEFTCTSGHPVWCENRGCYIPASALTCFDVVLSTTRKQYVQKNVQEVRGSIRVEVEQADVFGRVREAVAAKTPSACGHGLRLVRGAVSVLKQAANQAWSSLLFRWMPGSVCAKAKLGNHGADEPEIRIRPNEGEEPHEARRCSREGVNSASCHGLEANGEDGERNDYGAAAVARLCSGLGHGGRNFDWGQKGKRSRDELQGGHRESGAEDCDRSGRAEPSSAVSSGGGHEEGGGLNFVRVAGVEIQKRSRDVRFGGLCPDGLVYNLEVERHHNYFASGVLVHNCHHATASAYRKVIDYFRQNQSLRVLGVTATPDRADEEALGQVFDTVADDYEILDAVRDGWLVPIEQQFVSVADLDFSQIRTTAGDLNGADLARVMEDERNLHSIAGPAIEIIGKRRALVFTASVAHAERLSEIFNRHRDGMSDWVCGKTPKDRRRELLADFSAGRTQVVCNCGVLTEGFDDPGVEIIIMGRPTKSRSLYAQMVGRATRPLPGVVDGPETPEERTAAIAASAKPSALIVDFVGNSGRHKLCTSADILGGKVSEEIIEAAVRAAREGGKPVRMDDAIAEQQRKAEEAKRAEAARRARLVVGAKWSSKSVNPFDVFQIEEQAARGWDHGKSLSEKQRGMLAKQGIDPDSVSYSQARQLIQEMFRRWDGNLCSFKQAKILAKRGLPTNCSRDEAKAMIDQIAAREGWGKAA